MDNFHVLFQEKFDKISIVKDEFDVEI